MYLGLSQNKDDIEWYIGWFFLYRIAIVIPMVYLGNQQYVQVVLFLTFALSTMLIILNFRPFQYFHNMALELLNTSLIFMVGMLHYCFTPFMVDPNWRLIVGYFIVSQLVIVLGANIMLMWHSIMWQVFWRLEQEEKVFDALIKRNN